MSYVIKYRNLINMNGCLYDPSGYVVKQVIAHWLVLIVLQQTLLCVLI